MYTFVYVRIHKNTTVLKRIVYMYMYMYLYMYIYINNPPFPPSFFRIRKSKKDRVAFPVSRSFFVPIRFCL